MEEKQKGEMKTEEQNPESEHKKKRSKRKYILLALLLLFVVLLAVAAYIYYRGMTYYQTHFFPNTSINGIDCSDREAGSVIEELEARIDGYALAVIGRDYATGESGNVLGIIAPEDIQLKFLGTKDAVESLLEQQEPLWWIEAYLDGRYVHTLEQGVVFDEALVESTVKAWDACKRKNMLIAQDAYISEYSERLGGYEIIPETAGTEFDVEQAISFILEAVSRQEASIDIEEYGCYKEAAVKSDDKKMNNIVNTVNKWLGTNIVYDWNGTEVVLDNEILKEWISIEDDKPVLDEEAVTAFVKEQASAYDTYGKKKKFMTTHGFEVTLSSRTYGWKTDAAGEAKELVMLIYQGSQIEKEPLYSITARQKGANDVGDSYVEADLSNQHLYLYQDGKLVVETDFVSGTMISSYDCVTPEGIFGLSYKTKDAVLKGATYRTPVKYWMPFYGNYGMHDANWRKSFGGEIFKTNGSHGCINLPPSKAAEIYQYVSEGFPVVCYYSQGIPYVGPPTVPQPEGEAVEGQPEGEAGAEQAGAEQPVPEAAPVQ